MEKSDGKNTVYEYEIYLDDLSHGSLVGDNGDLSFNSEKEAILDAKDYINNYLVKDYNVSRDSFRIKTYQICNEGEN